VRSSLSRHSFSRRCQEPERRGKSCAITSGDQMEFWLYRHGGLQANRKTREGTNHPDRDASVDYLPAQKPECNLRKSQYLKANSVHDNCVNHCCSCNFAHCLSAVGWTRTNARRCGEPQSASCRSSDRQNNSNRVVVALDRIWRAYDSGRVNAAWRSAWPAILRPMSRIGRPSRVRSGCNCLRWRWLRLLSTATTSLPKAWRVLRLRAP
jgi:hypothetical protein